MWCNCDVIVVWCGGVWCGVVWCGVCGVVWCGVVWCRMVWCVVVWCDVVWCDGVWCDGEWGVMWGVVWCGVVWCVGCDVWRGVVRCDVVWCDVMWCDVMWCDVMWCGVVWCDVVWIYYNMLAGYKIIIILIQPYQKSLEWYNVNLVLQSNRINDDYFLFHLTSSCQYKPQATSTEMLQQKCNDIIKTCIIEALNIMIFICSFKQHSQMSKVQYQEIIPTDWTLHISAVLSPHR
jgi:hypothetical protein